MEGENLSTQKLTLRGRHRADSAHRLQERFRLRRTDEVEHRRRLQVRQRRPARLFLHRDKVRAQIAKELLAQVEVGILVRAQALQHDRRHAGQLGIQVGEDSFQRGERLLSVHADARELRRVHPGKRQWPGLLRFRREHGEKSLALGLRRLDESLEMGPLARRPRGQRQTFHTAKTDRIEYARRRNPQRIGVLQPGWQLRQQAGERLHIDPAKRVRIAAHGAAGTLELRRLIQPRARAFEPREDFLQ